MLKFPAVVIILILAFTQASAELRCVESEAAIEIYQSENLVLRYNKVPTSDAAKNDPAYTRTGYIHPLCTPSGKVVTGDYAPDHPHQHGLFFAWTKTSFEGRSTEFWNQKLRAGQISYVKTLSIVSKTTESGFDVEHLYEDLTAGADPAPVLNEIWKVRVQVVEGHYQVDLTLSQRCATASPLTIEKYHYGGMALRGNAQWLGKEDGLIRTSQGHGRLAGNHTRPDWVQMAGKIDGAACGVAVFCHPDNFRAPQWVRLHPEKPYFVFAPMVEEPFVIQPDAAYESRYRFVVFDGEMGEGILNTLSNAYR